MTSLLAPVPIDAELEEPDYICVLCEDAPAQWFVWYTCGCLESMCARHKDIVKMYLDTSNIRHKVCDSWHLITVERIEPI